MRIGFIGNGRMCKSFVRYLENTSVKVAGVLTRKELYTEKAKISSSALEKLMSACDVVFLTVKDDGIRTLAQQIAASDAKLTSCVFCHMSGSLCSDEIDVLACSNGIASFHTMTSLTGDYVDFSKVVCTLEGNENGEEMLEQFANEANLRCIKIKKKDKLLYHVASCICANYFVTLIGAAKDIYNQIGFCDEDAYALMLPLLKQVLENTEKNGVGNSLTGPISRGDCGTLKKHIDDLKSHGSGYTEMYRFMGVETVKFSNKYGIADEKSCREMEKILK